MSLKKILIIDDESSCRIALGKFLTKENYDVKSVRKGEEALELFKNQHFDLVITDLKMPDVDGMEIVSFISKNFPETHSIVMTGFGSIESSIEALKRGAFHYITKPFRLEEIKNLVQKAIGEKELQKANQLYRKELQATYQFENIIGESRKMKDVFELIEKVAVTDCTVLITGESGTGKELVVRAIHYNSLRSKKPLVTVNCGAIPESLLESELFGHMKGSFTGAISNREGRFETADKGTLFLDEIGSMPFALQVKLLRVLQTKSFDPVGGKTRQVDVRIIAATNRDLEQAVNKNEFREDLFYRLNVIPIHIAPLRERKEDIPLLIDHFVKNFNKRNPNKKVSGISGEALRIMLDYDWPGNVRQLENIIERILILKEKGGILPKDLPLKMYQDQNGKKHFDVSIPEDGLDFNNMIDEFEENILRQALHQTKWNQNKAAKLLKLKRTTLIEKLKRKKISKPL
ncbi:MAG: sigma-54-dependent Fis family transcriptional regulator [Deltaproteobacteria bacterium]|nr:sigma-54-dependent Fis family transcriptional regulator [Deltaproteobacteria bacterium]